MKYKNIIWDLDGTLLDTLEDLTDSVNYTMDYMGWKRKTNIEIRSFLGGGLEKLIKLSSPENVSSKDFDLAIEIFKGYYEKHNIDKTKPYSGVLELIKELKVHNIKMAILSNKENENVKKLSKIFFKNQIDFSLGDISGIRKKPSPDGCIKVMEMLGAKPDETILIGDSEIDYATACNAGLDYILVLWGFRDKEFLEKFGAQFFAKDINQLKSFLI